MDRVQGPQQPVRFDDGGADDVLVDLDILEGVKQPLRIRDQRGPSPRHAATDLDPQQVRADPAVAAVLAIEGEERLSMLLGGQELKRCAGVQVVESHYRSALALAVLQQRPGKRVRVSASNRAQPLRHVAGILRRTQTSFGLQPGKDRGPLRTLERDQPGDRRSMLGDLDRLTSAHTGDHLTGVMAQFPQSD